MSKTARILTFLLAAVMVFALALPAFADVIIEPQGSFYDKHENDCRTEGYRTYIVKEGGMNVCTEPGEDVKYRIEEGTRFGSQWIYTGGGTEWGYIEDYSTHADSKGSKAGWFKLEDTVRLYDYIDFNKEHEKDFYEDKNTHSYTSAVAYDYPNGTVDHVVDGEEATYLLDGLVFNSLYKDENGREWGFIGYRFGRRNIWICLDEPENTELNETGVLVFDTVTGEMLGRYNESPPLGNNADPTESDDVQVTHVCVGTNDPDEDPDATPAPPAAHIDPKTEPRTGVIIAAVAGAAAIGAAVLAVVFRRPKQ